jgi:hypothetical protein
MMRTEEHVVHIVRYLSEVDPKVFSESKADADDITWADAHPVVWKIVSGHRSAPFGKRSSTYPGWARGDATASVIHRVHVLRDHLAQKETFWSWRAQFSLDHYTDKGFRGGSFQQFDGTHGRGCVSIDYTPGTLDEVIQRFLAWCGTIGTFPTREVRIDDKCIRRYP